MSTRASPKRQQQLLASAVLVVACITPLSEHGLALLSPSLEIFSDFTCSGSYLADAKYRRACSMMARAHPGFTASWTNVAFRPYLLNPELEGKPPVNRIKHIEEKFGKPFAESIDAQQLSKEGLEYDLHFRFGSEDMISGTVDAHRLNQFVNTVEGTDATFSYRSELMRLFHEEGKALCDPNLLLAAVQTAGAEPEAASSILESAAYRMDVIWMSREAQKAAIESIPYYRFYTPDGIISISNSFDEWHILDALYRSFPETDCGRWEDAAAQCRSIVEVVDQLRDLQMAKEHDVVPKDFDDAVMRARALQEAFKQDILSADI